MTTLTVETPEGPARVHLELPPRGPHGLLMLGHGAGGGVRVPDLEAATQAALAQDWAVALVEQPYRVAGLRSAPRAPRLDSAWIRVAATLQSGDVADGLLTDLPLVAGGRSSGARVACRTAEATHAVGVLCLAFPLQPPARAGAPHPPPSRLDELEQVTVEALVIQGDADRFGAVPEGHHRTVVVVPGDHSLRKSAALVGESVFLWLKGRERAERRRPRAARGGGPGR